MWLSSVRKNWSEGTLAKKKLQEIEKDNAIETRAREIKDEVFNGIVNRHNTVFPIHAEMAVTVSSLKKNYGYEENEQVLKQVLEILYQEGKLRYEQNQNEYLHHHRY